MMCLLYHLSLMFGVVLGTLWGSETELPTQHINRLAYVPFEQFRQQYEFGPIEFKIEEELTMDKETELAQLPRGETTANPSFITRGPLGEVRFRINSRELFVEGYRHWMSFPLVMDDQGRLFIAKLDLDRMLTPLLMPTKQIVPSRVRGVVVDPGHGGHDLGAVSACGYPEKDATLDTARRLQKLLQAKKIPVVMTRSDDRFISLTERARIGSKHPGYVFVSIHYNYGPTQAQGIETFALTPRYASSTSEEGKLRKISAVPQAGHQFNDLNLLLAHFVHAKEMRLFSPVADRGVKRERFAVLRHAGIPAILVEGGFLSNPEETKRIRQASYRQALAQSIMEGILEYDELMFKIQAMRQTKQAPRQASDACETGEGHPACAALREHEAPRFSHMRPSTPQTFDSPPDSEINKPFNLASYSITGLQDPAHAARSGPFSNIVERLRHLTTADLSKTQLVEWNAPAQDSPGHWRAQNNRPTVEVIAH